MIISIFFHFILAEIHREAKLYFSAPEQLLSIFTNLEEENLMLIQKCQEAEDKLEEVKTTTKDVRIFFSHLDLICHKSL